MSGLKSVYDLIDDADELDIKDAVEAWMKSLDVAPSSKASYLRAIRQFQKFILDVGIKKPAPEDIKIFKNELDTTVKTTTVQVYIQAIKLFFKWTEIRGIYPDIAKEIKGKKLDRGHKRDPLTSKQANDVITQIDTSTLEGKRDYAILTLMLTTGLRTIEVQRAIMDDKRTIGDVPVLYIQGKGHEEKTDFVKLVKPVEDAINAYLVDRANKFGIPKDIDPLFASTSNRNLNGPLSTRSISKIAKEHYIKAGILSSRITAHSLRHTAATINLLNGASIQATQKLLRHKNINTTMIYSHDIDRLNDNSEAKIAEDIFRIKLDKKE